MRNNQEVQKGDTLLVVTQKSLKSQKQYNDSLLALYKEQFRDYNHILQNRPARINSLEIWESYAQYKARIGELQNKIALAARQEKRQRTLWEKQIIATAEYEKFDYELQSHKKALTTYTKQKKGEWQAAKRKLDEQIRDLDNKNKNLQIESENYVLTAPMDGVLEQVVGYYKNSFLPTGQPIASISPKTELVVENSINPNDIGLIKIGQKITYQLDAFNYNQWGLLYGKVLEIDKNITLSDEGAYFKVRSSMDTSVLTLNNGYSAEVSKGMTLTSRFFITRRSLWDLLFDKVDDWLNPKLINNN